MEDLENISHSESSGDVLKKKNILIKFWQEIWICIKGKIILLVHKLKETLIFLCDKLEQISFLRAVIIGIALGVFTFGMMVFTIALWLVR